LSKNIIYVHLLSIDIFHSLADANYVAGQLVDFVYLVGIATTLQAGRCEVRIPVGARVFFISLETSRQAVEPTQTPIQWASLFFPEGQAGRA
jgi:hypothetical protein